LWGWYRLATDGGREWPDDRRAAGHSVNPRRQHVFRDPDGHSLEFIAMLPDRPQPHMERMRLSAWRAGPN
jgi:hypothetical protein